MATGKCFILLLLLSRTLLSAIPVVFPSCSALSSGTPSALATPSMMCWFSSSRKPQYSTDRNTASPKTPQVVQNMLTTLPESYELGREFLPCYRLPLAIYPKCSTLKFRGSAHNLIRYNSSERGCLIRISLIHRLLTFLYPSKTGLSIGLLVLWSYLSENPV